jgi:thiol-disulfide isomerase/thioredoxin
MIKRKLIFIIAILFVPLFMGSIRMETASGIENNTTNPGGVYINEIGVGNPALDFTLTEVDSRENYTLSDFLGQVVLLDLFATWCGPCQESIPMLIDINDMYPNDVLQIISIDVDETESDSLVSTFKANEDMDWIVGIDYHQNITSNDPTQYGTGYVPTFVLIDQSGNVAWTYIGTYDLWTELRNAITDIQSDDDEKPDFHEYTLSNNTELSIFDPQVHVTANVSDNWNLFQASISVLNEPGQGYLLVPSKVGDFYLIDQWITVPTNILHQNSQIQFQITLHDYFENWNVTEIMYLPTTQYVDAGAPTVSDIAVSYEEVNTNMYEVTVYAIIEEDLMLEKAVIELYKETEKVKTFYFEDYNGTHMVAEGMVFYSAALPEEVTVKIVVEDVAGNEVIMEYPLVELEESDYGLTLILVGLMLSAIVFQVFRRRK